ncbi:8076_t:CDS:1, partial [Funneliformis geosporum]
MLEKTQVEKENSLKTNLLQKDHKHVYGCENIREELSKKRKPKLEELLNYLMV